MTADHTDRPSCIPAEYLLRVVRQTDIALRAMPEILPYQTPHDSNRLPGVLVAVAWIHIAFGILSAIQMVIGLLQSSFRFNLGVFGILIGRGLLRRSASARTWALVFIWIEAILYSIMIVSFLGDAGPHQLTVGTRVVTGIPALVITVMPLAALLVLACWQYRVLVRPDIRLLFYYFPRRSD